MRVRKRPLGKTGLTTSALGLGTFALSGDGYGPVAPEEARRTVQRALELGITLFETADAYAAGAMEQLLGELLPQNDSVVVVSKAGIDRTTEPARRRFDADWLRGAIERSRARLGRDVLDVYLLHNPSETALRDKGALDTLLEAKAKGWIKHVGVSTSRHAIARDAIERGAEVVSVPYNALHVQELNHLAGDVMVSGTGVLGQSPLAYGLLSGVWSHERSFDEGDHRAERWSRDELEARLGLARELRFLVRGAVPTPRGAALRFALSNDLLSSVLLGPKSEKQLVELVRDTGDGPVYLPDNALREAMRTLEKHNVPV